MDGASICSFPKPGVWMGARGLSFRLPRPIHWMRSWTGIACNSSRRGLPASSVAHKRSDRVVILGLYRGYIGIMENKMEKGWGLGGLDC